ncbi:MAG: hydroxylase [Verrucomicrobiota bacterium]
MNIQYLEIVTPEVDPVCETYARLHDTTFAESDPNLGGARTAKLANGGLVGVRAPLRDTETPVVRTYYLVKDIEQAVKTAAEAGAEIAMGPTEIPDSGQFAIFIQGGIETGLWQV